jgi:abortive infection bacteriophage resistance protein
MKSIKTIPEQIEILKSRNLIFEDESKAEQFLLGNNYYRLTGYWRKYQINSGEGENKFVDNTTLEKIVEIYELDILLRNILQKGIGIFEVCFRSRFAYYTAISDLNGLLYSKPDSYINKIAENESRDKLLAKINKEIEYSNERFIEDYKKDGNIPIWVAIEVLGFGTVSKMYSLWANKEVTKQVIKNFNLFKDYYSTRHIIRSLVDLRNSCAHQKRIWDRRLIAQVLDKKYLQKFGPSDERSQWRIISILMSLVDEINRNQNYSEDVLNLCKQNEEFYKGLIKPTL